MGEKALTLAQPDLDTQMLQKQRKDHQDAQELRKLTMTADNDFSGTLSLEEYTRFMQDPKFRSFFEMRGLDIKDAEMFFHMLTAVTQRDEVDIQTFVEGALRMRGFASSLDLHTLSFEVKVLHLHHKEFVRQCLNGLVQLRVDLA